MSRPNSILDAIHGTRHAFQRINMEPPDITLARHDEGMNLLGELANMHYLPHNYQAPVAAVAVRPQMPNFDWKPDTDAETTAVRSQHIDLPHVGKLVWVVDAENPEPKPYMEVQVMGIKVRWPARRMTVKDGESIWY
jgi:hypothetical protein